MKNLVIIGGGFAGARIAKKLQNKFNVTLTDTKDYFEFTPGILRTLVEPNHLSKILVKHKKYLPNASFIQETIKEITPYHVKFGKNNSIPYDYLVIASGSHYSAPIKQKDIISTIRSKEVREHEKKITNARKITIVGGGLVGLELAAELCTHYPEKKITIVHAGNCLIERNCSKSQKYALRFLKKNGVEILFNEHAKDKKNSKITTKSGRSISSDLTFFCTGIIPNTQEFQDSISTALTHKKYLEVNEFLQLKGHHHIFVAGDVTGIKEEKTAQTAESHADLIIKNILRKESNKSLIPYKSKSRPMVISLGKYNGIFEYKGFIIPGLIPAFLKWAIERKTMWRYGNYRI